MDDAPAESYRYRVPVDLVDGLEPFLDLPGQGFRFFRVGFPADNGKGGIVEPGNGGIFASQVLDNLSLFPDQIPEQSRFVAFFQIVIKTAFQ